VERAESRTIQIVVHGDVQGVGFRWFTRQAAEHLGVSGTVANQRDGTVCIVANGRPDLLDRLQVMVREGPPHAAVTRLEVHELPETFSGRGFSILH
jgi:acylphosphatase